MKDLGNKNNNTFINYKIIKYQTENNKLLFTNKQFNSYIKHDKNYHVLY